MTEAAPARWHRVPTRLTDELMPRLKDTELRVLLVVLRQTWGWRAAPGARQRKRRDWLSHSQLCRRTGRGSGAVSGAVAALVKMGQLVVEDAGGRELGTPEERRRHLGRLYYRPGDAWTADADVGKTALEVWKTPAEVGITPIPSHPGKPKTTKDNQHKRERTFKNRTLKDRGTAGGTARGGGWHRAATIAVETPTRKDE